MPLNNKISDSAKKLRAAYAITPGAPFYHKEFGYYCIDEWKNQGLDPDATREDFIEIFNYDPPGNIGLGGLGGTVCDFYPAFEEKLIEDRGEHEVRQDKAGRHVLYFKGRTSGYMPEYIDNPVKDMKTWEENVKWRLDPGNAQRYADLETELPGVKDAESKGLVIVQYVIGAYMYLRSLIGPEKLLYFFYDNADLIHECLKTWLTIGKSVTAFHQKHVTLDEIYFDEDICYNHGPLISPDMIREFLFPYYRELISAVRSQQIDKKRRFYIQVDSDGAVEPVIPLYQELGMDIMEPFEVASGCDVVEIGRKFPDLVISGGIDKRVLALTKKDIDKHLEYILPAMRARGGYIPTCDHGVPTEVSLENYVHYRKRCVEIGG